MKIVITGAAGAIGSHIAERLVKEGHQVMGIDALTPYYDPKVYDPKTDLKTGLAKEISWYSEFIHGKF